MSNTEELYVRLKAHEPKRGHVLRCYCVAGVKFNEAHGWYRVPADLGEYLRSVRQVADDMTTPLAFDVCTEADAQALDVREQEEKERRSATHAIAAEPRVRASTEPRRSESRNDRREPPSRESSKRPAKEDTPKAELEPSA